MSPALRNRSMAAGMQAGQQTHFDNENRDTCIGRPIIAFGVYRIPDATPRASMGTDWTNHAMLIVGRLIFARTAFRAGGGPGITRRGVLWR